MNVVATGSTEPDKSTPAECAKPTAQFSSSLLPTNQPAGVNIPGDATDGSHSTVAVPSSENWVAARPAGAPRMEPLADGSFPSVGPDSMELSRFDQPTLVGLLIFSALCLIGWSTWQWLTMRSRLIDIDQGRRTELRFEVDLNHAPASEFANLPGIGPKLAAEIVAYRERNGRFTRFEELLNVSGIGEAKYKAILPFLRRLDPARTATEPR